MTRLLFSIFLLFSVVWISSAKENYEISTPVGLEEVGVNKVLCMKNGYTLLFHFEISKSIHVQVFDTTHTRVANTHISCKKLDLSMLASTVFKGIYEINGEAVLFFEQQNLGRHSLIRLRFNPTKGKLIDECVVGKSEGIAKPMTFAVMRHKKEEGYAVLFCQDASQFKESKIHVSYYNSRHEIYRDVPLTFDRKKYDYLSVIGAESVPEGLCISLRLSTMLVNGTGTSTESAAQYTHFLHVFCIPRDSTRPMQRTIDVGRDIQPYYTNLTYNPFAGNFNLLMLNFKDVFLRYGIEMRPTAVLSNLLFMFDEQSMAGTYTWLTNKLANDLLQEKTDTNSSFSGLPVKMITNSNGLTTVISESYSRYINAESYRRSVAFETFLGNICITQFDDDGKEIWGTVLPKSQYFRSYSHYYRPGDLAKRWQAHAMFNDIPPQVLERQFQSANIYTAGDNFYIIYNDCGKNINNSIESPGDTVYTSSVSNACYYKMNRKKEITKQYLLGEPLVKEYKSSFIEGADFDEDRTTYASLIRYKRGEYVSLRMAWVKMD